ncbi:MAG: outer membrane protein assembly factor BamA [Rickettsiaceae bacterium]
MNKVFRVIICLILSAISAQAFAERIEKITITGNQRVEKPTIQEYLGVKVGDEYSQQAKSDAIKSLYATSLFEDINISFQNGVLSVKVAETPFVSKVVFTGNSKVKTNLLTNEIHTAPGESLKKGKLRADVEKIKEIYKRSGRFSVQVKSKIEPQENNRVKVVFEITEGPKTGIKSIYFVGNQNYKDSELKSIILTKESRWFRFLETNDTYDPDRIEFDKHLLSQFYNSVGFADFRVISVTADLLPTKEGFILTYSIEEGAKYQFGKISLNNKLASIDNKEIWKFIDNKEGQTFNLNSVNGMSERISEYLAGKGYPQVNVSPELHPNLSNGKVDITLVVDQADKIFINKINVNGNLKTEDRVIRRQLKIAEGDVYNKDKIEKGERNIRNLDYFGKMSLHLSPTDKSDRYDINIDVEEKSTSSIGFDVGYNSSGGPFGRISFLERNLVGTGKYLNAGVQAGRKNIQYYAGLTDPNFMDKDLSLGGNFFRVDNGRGSGFASGEQNYASNSTGFKTSLGYDISEDLSHEIEYLIKRDRLKASGASSSVFIKEQMGSFLTSAVSHSLTYDKTDSRILPKNGYLLTGSQEYAGLGGNTKYLKHELDGKYFKSFAENKYTVKLSAAAGHIKGVGGKKVRVSDRFNLGDYTLRGFEHGGIGPRDIITNEGLGGQKYYTLSTELNFPVGLPEEFNVTGALFADAGSLWDADSKTTQGFHNDKSLRASVGFGVLWVTRIAPIRLDWGFPVKKKKYDNKQTFHIRFSTHF